MEYDAKEIVNMCKEHELLTSKMRKQWEDDYAQYRLDPYEVDISEGDYEDVTSNSPKVFIGKIVEYLTDGTLKFKTLLQAKDTQDKKTKGNTNEQFAYAMNENAEEWWQRFPEHKSIQGEKSFCAAWAGIICERVYLWEKDGKVVADDAVWLPQNTFWGTGKDGIEWGGYRRFITSFEAKELYGDKLPGEYSGQKYTELWDWWDGAYEKTVVGDKVVEQQEHKLGYPPVYIKAVGANPYMHGMKFSDIDKDWVEGALKYNRSLYPVENRIASYYLTNVALGVKTPQVLWAVGGTTENPFEANPYRKGSVIVLDASKYKELKEFIKPTMPGDVATFLNWLSGKINTGGLPPISYGDAERMQTLGGLNLLNHNALTTLKPYKKSIEQSYNWMIKECIYQFKNKKFKGLEFDGIDDTSKQYTIEISADKLDDKQRIKTELMLNLPTDEMSNAGLVDMMVKAGLFSLQRGMDKMGVEDPDSELDLIRQEKWLQNPKVSLPIDAANAIRKFKNKDLAKRLLALMEEVEMQEQQGSVPPPGGVNPQAMIPRPPQPNVPQEIMEKARASRMGLEIARQ